MINLDRIRESIVMQHGEMDCGAACLAMIIKFYDGHQPIERLRQMTGTGTDGTTLLGIFQAATKLGFDAAAYEATGLKDISLREEPCILHVVIGQQYEHYIVFFGLDSKEEKFVIGDPARGLLKLEADELDSLWKSRKLLQLTPVRPMEKNRQLPKWKWMLSLLREDFSLLGVASLLGIIYATLGLSTAIFTEKMVDVILPGRQLIHLIKGIGLLFLLLIIRNLINYSRSHLLIHQKKNFNNRISANFFSSLLYLPKKFFDGKKTGELITRLHDTASIQQTLALITGEFVVNLLIVIISIAYVFYYSFQLGLLSLISLPLYLILNRLYQKRIFDAQLAIMSSYAITESNYIDSIQGISLIKSNNLEPKFIGLTKSIYGSYQEKIYALGKTGMRFNFRAENLAALLLTTIFGYSSYLVLNNNLALGAMMGVLIMTGMLIPAVVSISLVNIQIQEAKVAFDRMFEFAQSAPEYEPPSGLKEQCEPPVFHSIQVENLSFGFPGRIPLMQHISFQIGLGETLAIVGESGKGKSTLIQLLLRFYSPDAGTILVNGKDWSLIPTPSWRQLIGVVEQNIKLFNATLWENIALTGKDDAEEVIKHCEELGFDQFFEKLPDKYFTLIGEDGVKLSGGQKQLVALAQALYKSPKLLLLDEATAAMDSVTEEFVMDLLLKVKHRMAIILITHKPGLASRMDAQFSFDTTTATVYEADLKI